MNSTPSWKVASDKRRDNWNFNHIWTVALAASFKGDHAAAARLFESIGETERAAIELSKV